MLFNSVSFLIFFPLVAVGYFALDHKYRWAWLLAASCYFYMAFIPAYILILFFTIGIDYMAGILIEISQGETRKRFLLLSLFANIGVLALFKYFNFLNVNLANLASALNWNYPTAYLNIILPIGLSFHTFQSMSYTIEVYRGNFKAEKHLGILALYVMFFPQLVAGPIERPHGLLPQLNVKHDFNYQEATDGLKRMAWGFFKKLVIADRLAIFVNPVFDSPASYSSGSLIIATLFFAYQIYCDFSGYSDIAIGAAKVMGFRLRENFRQPYFSRSISEFWQRWHISLSSWFRDYFYITLGGNRVNWRRWQFNLLLTFLVSGVWHGANWTFVLWGALHGSYLIVSIWTRDLRENLARSIGLVRLPGLYRWIQVGVTFALVCFAWILFRAATISDGWYIFTHLFALPNLAQINSEMTGLNTLGWNKVEFALALISILILEFIQVLQTRGSVSQMVSSRSVWFRWTAYYVLILWIILFGVFSQRQFIYFQF